MNLCITCTKQGGTEKKMMPRASILRPASSALSNERTSRQWARAALFEHAVAPERLPSNILHFRGGSKGTSQAFRGSGTDSSGTCQAFCDSWARSSGHCEPAAALGQARAAISRASCGSGPGSSGHFKPAAAPGQARYSISDQLQRVSRQSRLRHKSPKPPKPENPRSGARRKL